MSKPNSKKNSTNTKCDKQDRVADVESEVNHTKGSNNNKRRNNKGKFDRDRNFKTKFVNEQFGKDNDVSWYKNLPTLFDLSTNISTYFRLGAPMSIYNGEISAPGIMTFLTITVPPYSENVTDPASVAAIGLYEGIRRKLNKPISNYEPADLFMMQFAISDIYAQYSNILRAFGIVNHWDVNSEYLPKDLIRALYGHHDNPDAFFTSIVKGGADALWRFNQLIVRANQFLFMPVDFKFAEKAAWTYSQIFTDSDTRKAQIYAHRKFGYWYFDETTYNTGTACIFDGQLEYNTIDDLLDVFEGCIEAIRNSSAVRDMTADMRQTFGDENTMKLALADSQYTVPLNYNEEVLNQLHNMDVMRGGWQNIKLDGTPLEDVSVTQDPNTNAVVFIPKIGEVVPTSFGNKLYNFHKNDVTQDDVMIAGQLKFTTDLYRYETGDAHVYKGFGSNVVLGIHTIQTPGTEPVEFIESSSTTTNITNTLVMQEFFDWCPFVTQYSSLGTVNDPNPVVATVCGDMDNYGAGTPDQLTQMLTTANLSLWNIPETGNIAYNKGK